MDLDIKGRWALVCAASKGLGKGCATALASEGANVVITARGRDALEATAQELRQANPDAQIIAVAGDITTSKGRVNNAGGPPPGDFRTWSREDWIAALDANMLTAIELIKATIDGMTERGFGRIVNITSGAVKAPIDVLGLSNGARSGLTGFIAGVARQKRIAERNVTVNNMLPGLFETDRLRQSTDAAAKAQGKSYDVALEAKRQAIPAGRFGTADEFGAFCAFLCSAKAGYLTGQNILLDGGAYPGTF
jgi:3-oxoacyl-[acyl-carrier protein] reductase